MSTRRPRTPPDRSARVEEQMTFDNVTAALGFVPGNTGGASVAYVDAGDAASASALAAHVAAADPHPGYLTPAEGNAAYQPIDTQLTSLAGLAYAGNALKVARVNAAETGFELATLTAGQSAIQFKDEGVALGASGTADTVDFTGSVTATRVGNVVTVNVPAAGGAATTDIGLIRQLPNLPIFL